MRQPSPFAALWEYQSSFMYAIFDDESNMPSQYAIAVDVHPTDNALLINMDFEHPLDLEVDLRDHKRNSVYADCQNHDSGAYRLELPSFDVSSYTLRFSEASGKFYRVFRIMKAFC